MRWTLWVSLWGEGWWGQPACFVAVLLFNAKLLDHRFAEHMLLSHCTLTALMQKSWNWWKCVVLPESYTFPEMHLLVVQLLSLVWLFATPGTAACQAPLSFTISQSLLKFMSTESVMPFNYLILCHPLLLLPSILPSISVFSYELAHRIRWSKYWSFTFSISPSNEYSGLLSFRNNWFDLLDVQATIKSLLQCHSSETSILWCSTFFMVPLLSWCAVTQLKVKIQVLSHAIYLFIYLFYIVVVFAIHWHSLGWIILNDGHLGSSPNWDWT